MGGRVVCSAIQGWRRRGPLIREVSWIMDAWIEYDRERVRGNLAGFGILS